MCMCYACLSGEKALVDESCLIIRVGTHFFHINENVFYIIIHHCVCAGNYRGAVCIMRTD